MDLYEIVIPAREELRSWTGNTLIELTGGDKLKIKSDGVDHLKLEIPSGKTYSIRIKLSITEV